MSSRGRLIVFAAPSGGGKGTIISRLKQNHPDWGFSISATTRPPRPGEIDGREYFFLSPEDFKSRVEQGDFLEYEEVHGNLYGTLKSEVSARLERGVTTLFDLDVKGALSVKQFFPEALTIFLKPPSQAVLEQRLRGRKTETESVIQTRLSRANMEMDLRGEFDVQIVNDDLEETVQAVEDAITAFTAARRIE